MTALASGRGAREALLATAGLLLLLTVVKTVGPSLLGNDWVYTLAAGFQIYVPLWLIHRAGELPESHRIHIHGLLLGPIAALRKRHLRWRRSQKRRRRRTLAARQLAYYGRGARLDSRALVKDLGLAILIAFITFPPFAVAHWITKTVPWQEWSQIDGTLVLHAISGAADVFSRGIARLVEIDLGQVAAGISEGVDKQQGLLEILAVNIFLVGLPEELFYRGFLETRLERLWPTRLVVFLIPISRTVILASLLFALGHVVGEWNLARLGPFFPAFIFAACAYRSGSIAGAVLLHGLSNAFSYAMTTGYGP